MRLLFATQNKGKLIEAEKLLNTPGITITNPAEFSEIAELDVEETGATFEENALLKAKAFAEATGVITVSDDSGLEVTALGNQPGVQSKRFFPGSDEDRNQEILRLLEDANDRSARFKTVLCLYNPETKTAEYFEGVVEGEIAPEAKGTAGFGYDPIFIPEGQTQTFAELGVDVKNTLSHRARALMALHRYLEQYTT